VARVALEVVDSSSWKHQLRVKSAGSRTTVPQEFTPGKEVAGSSPRHILTVTGVAIIKNNCRSRPDFFTGKAVVDGGRRANKLHQTWRGNGDGMYAQETRRNTGSPSGDRGIDQLATRERQAGPCGVAERSVVPRKPGNAGGGKGPQLKTDARRDEGHGD